MRHWDPINVLVTMMLLYENRDFNDKYTGFQWEISARRTLIRYNLTTVSVSGCSCPLCVCAFCGSQHEYVCVFCDLQLSVCYKPDISSTVLLGTQPNTWATAGVGCCVRLTCVCVCVCNDFCLFTLWLVDELLSLCSMNAVLFSLEPQNRHMYFPTR